MTGEIEPEGGVGVVLVHRHSLISSGLRRLLEQGGRRLRVLGEAPPGALAESLVLGLQPDLILLDLDLGRRDLLGLPALLNLAPRARAVVLSDSRDPQLLEEALMQGAHGIVLKESTPQEFYSAVEAVAEGRMWMEPSLFASLLQRARRDSHPSDADRARIESLTRREREIVIVLAEGLTTREVAERLFVSETTVRHHLTSIFGKLGVSNRMKLVLYAHKWGLVSLQRD